MSTKSVPANQIEKIVINIGLGRLRQQSQFEEKILPEITKEMSLITGQKPAPCPAQKSIAGFKVRAGETVGLKTTLRGKRAADFLNRLINIVLPRVKDFRGITLKKIDGGGNLSIGLDDYLVFPEIEAEKSKVDFGLETTIIPKIKNREKAMELYKEKGIPLK